MFKKKLVIIKENHSIFEYREDWGRNDALI